MAYERLFDLIEAHPSFGPRLRHALAEGFGLVLDYHLHPGRERWCVSVHALAEEGDEGGSETLPGQLPELAHVKDFGREREDCVPLLGPLSIEMQRRYRLERAPRIHLEGHPFRGL